MRGTIHMAYEGSRSAADARGRLRAGVLLSAGTAVVLWVLWEGVTLYGHLPDRVPIHFNLQGEPDGWAGKSVWSVLGMPMLAAVLVVVMGLVSRLQAKWYNFPGKERVLALPKPLQDHVIAPMQESLAWMGAGVGVGISCAARDGWAVAMGHRETMGVWSMLLPMALGLVAILAGVLVTRRRLREVGKSLQGSA